MLAGHHQRDDLGLQAEHRPMCPPCIKGVGGRGRGVSKHAARTNVHYMELTRICALFGIKYGINMVCYTC